MDAPDPHAPLRDDVHLLGQVLGEVLRAHAGEPVFATVEEVRTRSKAARAGDAAAATKLAERLAALPPDEMLAVARAFAQFLSLANIAEQHHRVRRRRAWRADPEAAPQRGSVEDAIDRLRARGVAADAIARALAAQRVELVLTAHPTEVQRRTVLQKHARIGRLLDERDRVAMIPEEAATWREALAREVATLWGTDEIRRRAPTPEDEVRGGLVVVQQMLWDTVPAWLRTLDAAMRARLGEGLPAGAAPIRFGTWMGGDRDGNPNVTAEVTRRAVLLARWMGADLWAREVDALRDELSLARCSDALRARVGDAPEPYRALLRPLRERLRDTRAWAAAQLDGEPGPAPVLADAELVEPLAACDRSLRDCGAGRIADGRLADALRRAACFGLSLVRLDVRQEAGRHAGALDAITRALGIGGYLGWDEDRRQRWLAEELAGSRPLVPRGLAADPEVREVLDTFRVLAEVPRDSLGAYVISMAAAPSDVLAVALLQRECGVTPPLRVVPLFETLADLERAGDVVRALLAVPVYREGLDRQEVMIGYSDSAKDAGRLAAAWALHRAQEDVVAACRDAGVAVTLFHGRGGSVGRGGGPTHAAILAQPPGSVDGSLRVTEQGEMVSAKFETPGVALRSLELYASATLEATLAPPASPSPAWREAMDRMSATSVGVYRATVRDPRFFEYFRAATPLDELGALAIGSRPPRRRKGGGLETLRAIPWIFAWTQVRLMLPTWLGVGEALAAEDPVRVREMAEQWPFFRTTLEMVEMSVAKALPDVHARYDALLVPPALRDVGEAARARFARTRDAVLAALGHREPLEGNEVLRRSIAVRNPYVDPLNLLQAELLRRARARHDETLVKALMVTINGIAAGMRNTG
ncbi:MAG: phosphoenolpyruvate carboxylase [Myxococcota bacterium]